LALTMAAHDMQILTMREGKRVHIVILSRHGRLSVLRHSRIKPADTKAKTFGIIVPPYLDTLAEENQNRAALTGIAELRVRRKMSGGNALWGLLCYIANTVLVYY